MLQINFCSGKFAVEFNWTGWKLNKLENNSKVRKGTGGVKIIQFSVCT